MKPNTPIDEYRDAIRALTESHRANNPRLFGSFVRGEAGASSDVDVLVDPLPDASLLDLGSLQVELELLLNRSVDVVTPNDLPAEFRQQVLNEARPI